MAKSPQFQREIEAVSTLMLKRGWVRLTHQNTVLSASRAPRATKPSGFLRGLDGKEYPLAELWIPIWVFILLKESGVINKTLSISGTKKRRVIKELNRVTGSREAQVAIATEYIMADVGKEKLISGYCQSFIDTVVNESNVRQKET